MGSGDPDLGDLGAPAHRLNSAPLKRNGFATLLAVLLIALLAGAGLEGSLKANMTMKTAHQGIKARQALYMAEGGVEWAKHQIVLNDQVTQTTLTFEQGWCKVSLEKKGAGYWVLAQGKAGSAERKIRVFLTFNNNRWAEAYYQEVHS